MDAMPEATPKGAAELGWFLERLKAFLFLGVLKTPRVTILDAFGVRRPHLSGRPTIILCGVVKGN